MECGNKEGEKLMASAIKASRTVSQVHQLQGLSISGKEIKKQVYQSGATSVTGPQEVNVNKVATSDSFKVGANSTEYDTGYDDVAYFLSLAWAIESMISHKCLKIYFVFEGGNLVNAINRPNAWPSFKFEVKEIRRLLDDFLTWRLDYVSFEANRGPRLIADSAVTSNRYQSYVARGCPRWWFHVFGCRLDPFR
ncbi:hypothetical protein F2Q68_00027657 [Brassica cretica]|uniref:RNase H type-1 domain-containing protein n=1 Tax=Brassica cretica TaxID=69181 RepID=A0A8S9IK79_BRACR|nr:hypothetical protein F2Q68_00027657 [Brassica cretica]